MKKLGIIYCSYNTESYTAASLAPWISARAKKLGGIDYAICVVSVPFEKFLAKREDGTLDVLIGAKDRGEIDLLISQGVPMAEVDARGKAMKMLIESGCDCILQADSDEFYLEDQIAKIVDIIQRNPLVTWFRLSLKNYVFDEKTYLAEPFQPPRVHRVKTMCGCSAAGFWDDNSVFYADKRSGAKYRDRDFSSKTVGPNIAWIRHLTWLNDERSKKKTEYQVTRWGADLCSFAWDEKRGGLVFNERYYERAGMELPELLKDFSE